MITKEESTLNFMTPGSGVRMLGRGHIRHNSEYAISFTLSMYSTLIAIDYRIIMLLSKDIINFYLLYDGTVDMQI